MKSKNLTELTDAELLELIENPVSSPNTITNNIIDFISVYNLKTGDEPIKIRLLYNLYKAWTKNPLSPRIFSNTLTNLFTSKQSAGNTLVYLNKSAINVHTEVLKLVEPADKTRQKGWTDHFNKYLLHYGIKKGGLFIANNVLYNLYDKWTYKNNNRRPLGPNQFNNFCKVFFEYKNVQGRLWFKIDKSIEQHLTEDLIKLMYKKKAKGNAKKDIKKK